MANFNMINSKDAVYAINAYNAMSGLQRFQYRYTAQEQDHDEIGNPFHVDTSTEPETSGTFEVTDTGSLAALFARMRYDYGTQSYMAGAGPGINTNVGWTITEDDLQYMVFDLVEQQSPGGIFSEAKLIPNAFLTRFNIRLTADAVGTVSLDWQGNLLIPVYQPYHDVRSYPAEFSSATEALFDSGWGVSDATHGILGGMINNDQLEPGDLQWNLDGDGVELTAQAVAKGYSFADNDRIMVWLFKLTPDAEMSELDYVNAVRYVKPDRINLWLVPAGDATTPANRMLKIQSFDLSADIPRDQLREIAKNEQGTSTFYWHTRYPLNFTGTINFLETTLHQWANLQGKTLNESADTSTVDMNNVLDVKNFQDAKIVAEWYKYGSDNPIQRITFAKVKILGYDGSLAVNGRKEAVWSWKSDGNFVLEGLSD